MREANVATTRALCALVLSMLIAAAAVGCIEKDEDKAVHVAVNVADVVKKTRPTPQHALDIRFEDKVRLIGYDLAHTPVVADRPFKVTWYWQVDKALGEGFQVFTHIADGAKLNRLNLDADRAVRSVHPVDKWRAGEFIADMQEVTLPKDWNSDAVIFFMGFYKGEQRLRVATGPNDGKNRAEALRLPVQMRDAAKPLARLVARYARTPITLDGKLDEQEWKAAQPTGPLVSTMDGKPASFEASAQVAYDAQHLYVAFVVKDERLQSKFLKHDDHLWEQDCVEVMLDPDGDSKNYFELQVSPRGVSFDTRYDAPRNPRPFGHVDWESSVQAKLDVRGSVDDDEDDDGYTVEMAIPWTAFAVGATPAIPPIDEAVWRMNFFVMNSHGTSQRAAGWSAPLVGDFHTLERFGRVVFPVAAVDAPTTN